MTCTNNNVESYQRHLTADEVIRSAICSVEKREMEKLHINYLQSQSSLLGQPVCCPRCTATQFAIPFRPPQVPVDYRSKHHPHNVDYCQPPARLCDTQQNRTHSPAYCPRYTATQPTVHHRPQMPVDIELLPPPRYSDCSQPPVRKCDMQQHETTAHSPTQPTPDEHFSLQLSPPLTPTFPTNYNSVKSYMDSQWEKNPFILRSINRKEELKHFILTSIPHNGERKHFTLILNQRITGISEKYMVCSADCRR